MLDGCNMTALYICVVCR